MLLSESDVMNLNFEAILDEAVYLDESEAITKIPAIPVVENGRIGAAIVSINDLNSIVEDYGCDYEDAFCAIAEQNELEPDYLAVSVEDWKLIETPELANMVPNIVVKPISEESDEYALLEDCFDAWCQTGDDNCFYPIIGMLEAEDGNPADPEGAGEAAKEMAKTPGFMSRMKAKASDAAGWVKENPGKTAIGAGATAGAIAGIAKLVQRYKSNKAAKNASFGAKIMAAIHRLMSKVRPGSPEQTKLQRLATAIKNNKKKIAAGVGAVGLGTAGYLNRNRISNFVNGNKQPKAQANPNA